MKKHLGERGNTPERKQVSKEESKRSSLVHFSPLDRPHTRGGPFLCPPVPRRVRSSDQCTEPLLGQAGPKCVHNPIVRSLLADGRTQEGSAPTQLHEPCLSDGLLRIVSS